MLYDARNLEEETALEIAKKMAVAARTAPKASGKDKLEIRIIDGEDREKLADFLEKAGKEKEIDFFIRDSNNLRNSKAVLLIGMNNVPLALDKCGICGFVDCAGMIKAGGRCAFNVTDLGIAVGSAVSIAADSRIDNRVLYSAGKVAVETGFFENDIVIAYAIPLSVSSKSIYFDRNKDAVLV